MLGNYEQTIFIPNQWSQPQNNQIIAADDETPAEAAAMAHQDNQPIQNQNQNQNQNQKQEALRCPRCDSSNTKFCYYNNYSLSQPRHFCKACKRYWTRGGTLRNVPVGGTCRKYYKRVKKPPTNISSSSPSSSSSSLSNHLHDHHLGLLYGVPVNNPNPNTLSYDLQNPQIFQDLVSSSSNPLLMSSFTNNGGSYMKGLGNSYSGTILPSYGGVFNKEVKVELEGQNRQMDQNTMGMMGMGLSSSSDPSLSFWGGSGGPTNSFLAWLDPSSSSVPSLM